MAGIRHHILPRFLMKGFASRTDKDSVFVWVYRKNANPFESNTVNISVEKHFYGRDGEVNADDEITKIESEYVSLINNLRNTTSDLDVCDPKIAEFIAHLSIRTKNVRNGLLNTIDVFTDRFTEVLTKPATLENLVKMIKPHLLKEFSERFPTVNSKEFDLLANKIVQEMLEKMEKDKDAVKQIITDVRNERSELLEKEIPNQLKEKHNQLILDEVLPSEKIATYKKLNWFVATTKQPLIIGDTGCLFETGGLRRFKAFEYTDDYLINIFLPISTNKIVVGTRYAKPQPINTKTINKAFALSSFEYFICSENTPEKIKLSSKIGEWFGIMQESELNWTIQSIFKEMFKDIN